MKKILLSLLLVSISIAGYSKIWTINNSGSTFSPATITIVYGDTVRFTITVAHDAREVSQTTWNAGGTTALPGGFQTPFGGGLVLPTQLGVGTHYYICTPHVGIGMKGTIIVQSCPIPATPAGVVGSTVVCPSTSYTYSVSPVSGATSYVWTLPNGWTGSSTSNSITTTTGTSSGTISVAARNTCGTSATRTLSVTVNAIPATPTAISGNTSVAAGSTNIYSTTPVSGATSYVWTLPNGWTGSSTTSSITTVAGTNGGTISVAARNACGTSSARTLAVTVPCGIPQNPRETTITTTLITLAWDAVPGATLYEIVGSRGNQLPQSITTTNTSKSFSGNIVAPGKNYNWKVRAQCAQGWGEYTTVRTFTTPLALGEGSAAKSAVNLTVSPNPTNGTFTLQLDEAPTASTTTLRVYNSLGKLLSQQTLRTTSTELHINDQPAGVYFVHLSTPNEESVIRLVKN